MGVALRLDDPDHSFQTVRLASDLHLSDEQRTFARNGSGWVLDLELPQVLRLEYKLEVIDGDGNSNWILDPDNPKRAPRAFGDKSVLELPGYTPPAWLEGPAVRGRTDDFSVRGRGLGANVGIRVWA